MPKITFTDYGPDDPVYREGPRSYSPHWARALLKPTTQKQQQSPPKLTEEQERLVADIQRHHPNATTEGILEQPGGLGGGVEMAKHIHKGWSKSGDEIPQPIGVVLGRNLRQNTEPKIKQPSPMQLEERARLVAEIKRHHPMAITEQIIKHLEVWGE